MSHIITHFSAMPVVHNTIEDLVSVVVWVFRSIF